MIVNGDTQRLAGICNGTGQDTCSVVAATRNSSFGQWNRFLVLALASSVRQLVLIQVRIAVELDVRGVGPVGNGESP